jgi:hypothetical protein
VLLGIGGALLLLSMVLTGVFNYLLAPPQRVLVVTMAQDADQADRVTLKQDCGSLAGVTVVPDQGDPRSSVQGRFPVRFDIGQATPAEEAALQDCINRHSDTVRGFLTEGDR